jgi:mono/diheme cytochrome c family protein
VDYPIPTGGKTLFSWQAFVPIMFEVMVLFATFTAGLGMLLLLNRLPFFGHPVLSSKAIAATTRDRFALAMEPDGSPPDLAAAREALREAGASEVEVVAIPAAAPPPSPKLVLRASLAIAISCVVAGYATYWAVKLFPVLPPMAHMQEQPRIGAQEPSGFFRDGLAMRIPQAGTVARGAMPYLLRDQQEAGALGNPLPRTEEVLRKGREAYNSRCTVCHGALGDGVPTLTAAYGAKPADLHTQALREVPDGAIYHVIMAGKNAMPSYAADLTEEERWSVIHYVRALQRARNARDGDLR